MTVVLLHVGLGFRVQDPSPNQCGAALRGCVWSVGVLSAFGGRLHDAVCDLGRTLEANGLGLPWHAEQLPQRTESAALYGCEL